MVSAGMTCVKYLLFLFNLIFAITGIIFITLGSINFVTYNGYKSFVDNWLFAAPVLMIIVGIVVFLVSFFGCCGAVKENHCMIITFSVLLLVIFALEVGVGVGMWAMRSEIGPMLNSRLNSTMKVYKTSEEARRAVDLLQHELVCCGMNEPKDWAQFGFSGDKLPNSCCKEIPTEGYCDLNAVTAHEKGCKPKLKKIIEDNAVLLGSVGLGIALIQLIGVIFACCLARSIRREYETV